MMKKVALLIYLIVSCMMVAQRCEATTPAVQQLETFIANETELEDVLYRQLLARNTTFQFNWTGDAEEIVNSDWLADIFAQVYEKDLTTSDDFDYLLYSVKEYELVRGVKENMNAYTLRVLYRERPEQLLKVNKMVNKSLLALKLSNDSAAVKVRKLHDFIIRRVKYNGGTSKDSAYAAIVEGQANSRGYALLAYKMLTEVGVPCRIVSGVVAGDAAFWNIVKIEGFWYYLDLARDDGDNEIVPVRYNYFLRGSLAMIKDHSLSDDYQMAEFEANHPVDSADYRGRKKLILQADAAVIRDKVGVGPFNELYAKVSEKTVDQFEKINDAITNQVLSALQDVFAGI